MVYAIALIPELKNIYKGEMIWEFRLVIDGFVKFYIICHVSGYLDLSTAYKYNINSYSISACYYSVYLAPDST